MNKGIVKWFNNQKGYGFIKNSEGSDIFVHYSAIANVKGFKMLTEGDVVEFDVADVEKGKQAINVMVIESDYTKFGNMDVDEEMDFELATFVGTGTDGLVKGEE